MNGIHERSDYLLQLFESVKYRVHGNDSVAAMIVQEAARDWRMQMIREERVTLAEAPATRKQRALLEQLAVEFSPEITKREASNLIDAHKRKAA